MSVAGFVEERHRLIEAGRLRRSLQHGDAAFLRKSPRRRLVPEHIKGFRSRPDKDQAGRLTGSRERGVLAQEAVTGMHGIAFAVPRRVDHLGHVEIGGRAYPFQWPTVFAAAGMQRGCVVLRKYADGGNSHVGCGIRNPDCDLSAVCDQQAFHRSYPYSFNGKRGSRVHPARDEGLPPRPARSDGPGPQSRRLRYRKILSRAAGRRFHPD